jgi:uncharacterized LabA/DUF88 family protein
MRVIVYIDGFNLYYRALAKTPYKWLDLYQLTQTVLDPADDIIAIKYYTARVSGRADPDQPRRQQAYLNALKTLPCISIYYGRFLSKTKWRPLVAPPAYGSKFVEIYDTEEKGSDVNLAAHLLHDGWKDRYDTALVMSQDSDLLEPLSLVKNELQKTVGLVWLDGQQPGRHMTRAVSFVRHLTPARLAASQFPNQLMGRDGHFIYKPKSW